MTNCTWFQPHAWSSRLSSSNLHLHQIGSDFSWIMLILIPDFDFYSKSVKSEFYIIFEFGLGSPFIIVSFLVELFLYFFFPCLCPPMWDCFLCSALWWGLAPWHWHTHTPCGTIWDITSLSFYLKPSFLIRFEYSWNLDLVLAWYWI